MLGGNTCGDEEQCRSVRIHGSVAARAGPSETDAQRETVMSDCRVPFPVPGFGTSSKAMYMRSTFEDLKFVGCEDDSGFGNGAGFGCVFVTST